MGPRFRNAIVQCLILTQIATPMAFADLGQRKPAASDPAYTSEEVAGKLELLTVKGEAKGYTFMNEKGQKGTLTSISQDGGEIRIGIPASSDSPAHGFAFKGTLVGKGTISLAVAAYDAKFQKRLTVRSIEISSDPVEAKLKIEQTIQSIQEEVRSKLTSTSLRIYDGLVPSAHAEMGRPIRFALHAATAAIWWYLYSRYKEPIPMILAIVYTALAFSDL